MGSEKYEMKKGKFIILGGFERENLGKGGDGGGMAGDSFGGQFLAPDGA